MKRQVWLAMPCLLLASNNWAETQFNDLKFPDPQQTQQMLGQNPNLARPNVAYPQYPYPYPSSGYPYPSAPYNLSSYPPMYNPYPYGLGMANPYGMPPSMPQSAPQKPKPWGDTRYIWPDFYTDFTGDAWDKMINAPHDMGYMPGGWRFPSISSPDPVTVGDAVANQVPPIVEEVPNFIDFTH